MTRNPYEPLRPPAIEPVEVEIDRCMGLQVLCHEIYAETGKTEYLQGLGDMVGSIGMVRHRIGEHAVEVFRVHADKEAEERRNGHGELHVPGGVLRLEGRLLPPIPDEVGELD